MKHPTLVISLLLFAYCVGFSTYLFFDNLPRWCSTPEVGHNLIVQPLCAKAGK